MSKSSINRPVQAGDHILITYSPKGGTISFFCISRDGSYCEVKPGPRYLFSHQYKSKRSGAKRTAALLAFALGCKAVEVQGWSPKPPPNFIADQTVVFRFEPILTK